MKFRYIYGPVSSWRLGLSLGIDLFPEGKRCNFDCIYCQIGRARPVANRLLKFKDIKKLSLELDSVSDAKFNWVTFSGKGEPTLISNLGEIITLVKNKLKHPVAVLTNGSLLGKKAVQKQLKNADTVIAKIETSDSKTFKAINKPSNVKFAGIVPGLKSFRKAFKGKFSLQIMFIKENIGQSRAIAKIAGMIKPDEIQLNTPLRRCKVKPLSSKEMDVISRDFKGLNVRTVYKSKRKKAVPLERKTTRKRRPPNRLFKHVY